MRQIRIGDLFVALLLASTLVFCSSETSGKSNGSQSAQKKKVKMTRAAVGNLPLSVVVSGTLAADEEVILSMKVPGRIQTAYVDLGSTVHRGQPLVQLEQGDFALRVRQAEATYQQARVRLGLTAEGKDSGSEIDPEQTGVVRQAKATLEEARLTRDRMESLFKEGLVAKSTLDDAVAGFQVADARYQDALEEVRTRQAVLIQRRAELDLAQRQLSDSVLKAPIDGAIQERFISPGQFVAAGDKVLSLVRTHPLRLQLAIPERDAGSIRAGQLVHLRVDGPDQVHTGRIARVSPAISEENRTLTIEAEIPNQDGRLRPGSFARAEIIVQSVTPVILVPESSIITFAGIYKVITVEKNRTEEKTVKLGRRSAGRVEILDGLTEGDPVVVKPGNLTGGQEVIPLW